MPNLVTIDVFKRPTFFRNVWYLTHFLGGAIDMPDHFDWDYQEETTGREYMVHDVELLVEGVSKGFFTPLGYNSNSMRPSESSFYVAEEPTLDRELVEEEDVFVGGSFFDEPDENENAILEPPPQITTLAGNPLDGQTARNLQNLARLYHTGTDTSNSTE